MHQGRGTRKLCHCRQTDSDRGPRQTVENAEIYFFLLNSLPHLLDGKNTPESTPAQLGMTIVVWITFRLTLRATNWVKCRENDQHRTNEKVVQSFTLSLNLFNLLTLRQKYSKLKNDKHVWTDDEVELQIKVTLEYQVPQVVTTWSATTINHSFTPFGRHYYPELLKIDLIFYLYLFKYTAQQLGLAHGPSSDSLVVWGFELMTFWSEV